MAQSYEQAGVNLEAGYEVVRRIKKHVASTSRLGVMGNIGNAAHGVGLIANNVVKCLVRSVEGTCGVGMIVGRQTASKALCRPFGAEIRPQTNHFPLQRF